MGVFLTGNHYKIVFMAPSAQLRSEELLFKFLRNAVKAIGCQIVAGPLIATIEETHPPESVDAWKDDGGISGVVVLSTSHVAAHFWTQERYGVIDAYSCKFFDSAVLVAELERHYDVEKLKLIDFTSAVFGEIDWDDVRSRKAVFV